MKKTLINKSVKVKKIVVATGIYPPEIGGPATYSKLLFDELPKKNILVDVCPFSLVRKLPKILRHFVYICFLFKKSIGADIIFAQDTVSVGFPAAIVSKLMRKRFFLRVPGDYVWEQSVQRFGVKDSIDLFQTKKYNIGVTFLRWIQVFTTESAEFVITPSNYFTQVVSKWTNKKINIKTIYNGIDFPSLKTKTNARVSLHIKEDSFVIVSSGRLVQWKGFKEIIEALYKIIPKRKNITLFILGDGPEKLKLEKLISDLNLNEHVMIVGQVPRDVMFDYLVSADVFLLNTSFESFSFQTIEAMYSGAFVIVSKIGSLPELVEDGISGLLFEVNNQTQMIDSLEKVMEIESTENIKKTATERAKLFSIERTIDELIKLF